MSKHSDGTQRSTAGSHSLRQVIVGNPFVKECVGNWEVGRQAGDSVCT